MIKNFGPALFASGFLLSASFLAATIASADTTCINLNNSLYQGVTDATANGEVTILQQFLGGPVTGYFGPITLGLVQSWQASNGVVNSGSPDTTGYGTVGPRTRAAMSCSGTPSAPTSWQSWPDVTFTPGVSTSSTLYVGQSFTDGAAGIKITLQAISNSAGVVQPVATVGVSMNGQTPTSYSVTASDYALLDQYFPDPLVPKTGVRIAIQKMSVLNKTALVHVIYEANGQ